MQNYGKRKLTSCRKCGKPYSVRATGLTTWCQECRLTVTPNHPVHLSQLRGRVEQRQRARLMASLRR